MDALLNLLLSIVLLGAILLLGSRLLGFRAASARGISGLLLKTLRRGFSFDHAPVGRAIRAPIRHRPGPYGDRPERGMDHFPLARSTKIYFVVLVGWIAIRLLLLVAFSGTWSLPIFALIHLICGLILNRMVLSRVVWHPHYDTLARVARNKMLALVLWPITYPTLFFQFVAVRYL